MTSNEIMGSPILYELVMVGIVYILIFCAIMFRKAYKHGVEIGLSKERMKTAIMSPIIYLVVPPMSTMTGSFSLAVAPGVPWPWSRLSVVGAVIYELVASDMVATGVGYESIVALNVAGDPSITGTVIFVMSIYILDGIVGVPIFGKKVQFGLQTTRKKSGQTGALVISILSLAIIEAFLPLQMMKGSVYLAAVLTSYLIVLIQIQMVKRFRLTWPRSFVTANTLLFGMASYLVWGKIL